MRWVLFKIVILLLISFILFINCIQINNTMKFIVKDGKFYLYTKLTNFNSLKFLSIEEIAEKKIIYLFSNEKDEFSQTNIIEISQEHLFFNFKLNKLYKYYISMTGNTIGGYFTFMNIKKPDKNEIISINNISEEVIILSYENLNIIHY